MTGSDIYSLEWTNTVKTIGRVFVYNEVLWLSYSGTGIEFVCNGGFTAGLVTDTVTDADDADVHYARYCVMKDGEVILDRRLTGSDTISVDSDGEHSFRLIKLSESNDSSMGIKNLKAHFHEPVPTPEGKLKMEFIGNSITCGYGVEGDLSQTFTTATENVSLAWAYMTAGKLGADYSIVSKSGAGLISGYTGDGVRNEENILTPYYDHMGCSMFNLEGDVKPQDFEYDFSFEPDVIVVNVGTNDISYCRPLDEKGELRITKEEETERRSIFYVEYKSFIEWIRELNPFSKIVCTLGVLGTALNGEVETAVEELRAAGDLRIFWLPLDDQNPEDGYGTDYHPSKLTQQKLAEKVAGFIETIIG